MVTRIEALLKERKISKSKFLSDLNLGVRTLSNWRDRGTIPSGAVLQKIADYFDVSVDYLLGKEDKKEKLSAEGEELIQKLLNGDSNKMQLLMFGGDGPKVIEIPEESKETVIRMLEALDKKNPD